jgi:CcmD family protein
MTEIERVVDASRYVAAAYSILWVALVAYVVSLGSRVSRLQRELALLAEVVERRGSEK